MEHLSRYKATQIKFYDVPGVGRYCEFELKFHEDYNWLISAMLEVFAKYKHTHTAKAEHLYSQLDRAFIRLSEIRLLHFDKYTLWRLLTDYAQLLLMKKEHEHRQGSDTFRGG